MKTYISLFSSGGVGCYGFKQENFDCVATVEIIERRLNNQKFNKKCKFDSGYIAKDIKLPETKQLIFDEIKKWKIDTVDVVIATPPCQGMSTANSKKKPSDIIRNSLVVESIDLINRIKPKFFIFENVPNFIKTPCVVGDEIKIIGEYIMESLCETYNIEYKIVNFKDYGVPSSRKRCLVIGVNKHYWKDLNPSTLFPEKISTPITLRESIFHLPRLDTMGEISSNDIYHFFRSYDSKMRDWISEIKEGQSAFDNVDEFRRPHKVVDGEIIYNSNKMGGKYKRQRWDEIAKCIHTRNDQLASQNTIHPNDDRVFSIRELMILMSIPSEFSWSDIDYDSLNKLSLNEKKEFLKKNEINIRQMIGEAVPTLVFRKIAKKISKILSNKND